jgi:ABC-type branched-subunit amino acid transport system substrate-binding protein
MYRALAAVALLVACHTARPVFVPEPDVPHTGNADARSRFLDARARFLRDGSDGQAFSEIVQQYPDDPVVPWAELYAGIASIKARDFAGADAHLVKVTETDVDAALRLRARLFLGIAKNYEGDSAGARALLAGADRAVENDDERTEFVAALAYATAAGDHPLAALPWFDELYPRVTPAERAVIVSRLEEVVAAADPNELDRAYRDLAARDRVAGAVAGSQLARLADQHGDLKRAQQLRDAVAAPRAAIGLPRTVGSAAAATTGIGVGTAGLIGALLPLAERVGTGAAQGLAVAAGATGGSGVVAIETRSAADPDTATAQLDQLARANVVAVVGPIDKASVDAAAQRANDLGVPLLSLNGAPEQRVQGHYVFHMRHSPVARARALAKRALTAKVTTFAVLSPQSPYGTDVGDAFADEVTRGGGKIVVRVDYPNRASATALVGLVKAGKLGSGWQAVFVPDDADELELVVSALASDKSRIVKPVGTKKTRALKGAQPVVLLATAEGLAGKFLSQAGLKADGALLSPGFYADDADSAAKDFLDRFVAAYGHTPTATEAYAYDAAQIAAGGGANGRSGLADALAHGTMPGVTGNIQFDNNHLRVDPGKIYTVVEETGGTYAIRLAP